MAITRVDFQNLAEVRVRESEALLAAGLWNGAYYLTGYAVECGLKSCIIKKLMGSDVFPEKKFSENCYKHNLTLLLRLAGLEDELNGSGVVAENWATVKDWSELSRYERDRSETEARDIFRSVSDENEGVLPWLRTNW